MANITKIARTSYDGFILVKRTGSMIFAYEGYALCPKDVKNYIDNNGIKEIGAFHEEAISYGYF